MYDVSNLTISKRRHEKITALNGVGWQTQAKTTHDKHEDYCKRTLYARSAVTGREATARLPVPIIYVRISVVYVS